MPNDDVGDLTTELCRAVRARAARFTCTPERQTLRRRAEELCRVAGQDPYEVICLLPFKLHEDEELPGCVVRNVLFMTLQPRYMAYMMQAAGEPLFEMGERP